jgi:hypothetical protein
MTIHFRDFQLSLLLERRTSLDIFGGFIPQTRRESSVNQHLDPYLQHLFLKFVAAPFVD